HRHGGRDLEGVGRVAGARTAEALVEGLLVHALLPRREEHGAPAVGDLCGQGDVVRALGTQIDRHVGAQRVDRRLERLPEAGAAGVGERVVLAVEGYRGFARKYLADDRDVLARAGQRLGEGLAVPAFDDLGTGDAEAEHEAAAAQVVEGQGGHGRGRRRAGRELDEVGTQLDA